MRAAPAPIVGIGAALDTSSTPKPGPRERLDTVILVLPIVLIALAIPALCIWAAVDAASQPEWAFEAAGTSKTLWIVLPIAGFFVCLVGVVAAIMWFTTYKPRVENAARGGSGFPPRVA